MSELETLEQSLQTLLDRFASLQQEKLLLQEENERQRREIMRTHSELLTLQEQHKRLRIAQGLGGSLEQREIAKRNLTNIICQVDRAIEILKQ